MAEKKRPVDPETTWGTSTVAKQQWADQHAEPVRKATKKANDDKETGGA